jgi:signal transduction histidine kinase
MKRTATTRSAEHRLARKAPSPTSPAPSSPDRCFDPAEILAELRQRVGLDTRDDARLRSLAPLVDRRLASLIDRLYRELGWQTLAREIPVAEAGPFERLPDSLAEWLRALFNGTCDARHAQQCAAIGRTHACAGHPQHRLFTAIEVIRQELALIIRGANVRHCEIRIESLHKRLAIETALLASSYQDAFVQHVRTSERSAVQERLTQAEHLAQIGRLAASLAHEIKNPLAGISGAIQVIRDAMPADAPHRPILAEVLRQINRLDQTVKDLLVYARPVPPRFGRCNLDRVIERVVTVLQREPEMQRVRFEHRHDHRPLPAIEADDNQIEQLLINLLLNAAQASEDGGLVTLAANPIATGVQLEVADRGHGMDEGTRRRALEPFFTTKSRGTGLGLPICDRIVAAHGGTLTIHSVFDEGTTVALQLPLHQAFEARGTP